MNLLKMFKKTPKVTSEQMAIIQLNEGLRILENHLIAIARLHFIKPETLIREANNLEANKEYLEKLIKERSQNDQ